jgi:hypothetical protein
MNPAALRKLKIQRNPRMLFKKFAPQRGQVLHAKADRNADLEQAACLVGVRRDLRFGCLDAGKNVTAPCQEHLALLRQREPPRGALHEAHAQALFEFGHVAGHGRLGHGEAVCGCNEAARIRYCGEHPHFLKFIQVAAPSFN